MSQAVLIFYNWTIWNFCFAFAYKRVKKHLYAGTSLIESENSGYIKLFILFFAFSIFTFFGGDVSRYKENIELIPQLDITYYQKTMEYIYIYIAMLVKGNFYLWKAIIYGSALAITYLTTKKLKVDNFTTLLAFISLLLVSYGATRAVLSYSIYVLGIAFLSDKNKTGFLIGISLCLVSYFFHSSMLLVIILTPVCFLKLTSKRLLILIILFPIMELVFNSLLADSFSQSDMFGDYVSYKMEKYTDAEGEVGTNYSALNLIITETIKFLVVMSLLYFAIKQYLSKNLPTYCDKFIVISFAIVYMSFLFRFSNIFNNVYLYNRYFSIFPFVIYLVASPLLECYRNNIEKVIRYKNILFICGNVAFFFLFYLAYVNHIKVTL